MHSIDELGTNVPAFLAKLWKIVEDPETNDLICWSPGGTSFFIRNQARFARELLPLYYKHNNMASFVRQLNMYGFHKVVSIDGGGLKLDKDEMEFAHQYFLMGHPYLLEHIKRKISTTHKVEEGRPGAKPELMNKVLADVKNMKGRQDTLDNQLNAMKRENEVLWREVAILRQKHLKQQQIVNKLIQFLVSMVQSSRNGGIGIKRHYPLMLNDTSHRPRKVSKLSSDLSDLNTAPSAMSPTGPVIHELDATDLLEECEPKEGEEAAAPTQGDFLSSEFCNVEEAASDAEQQSSSTSKRATSASPDPITVSPSPQVLLELAEECPLSPSMLLTASPMDVNPSIVAPRLGKGKLRSRIGSTESRRRKSKKTLKTKDGSSFSVTPESSANSQEAEDNGVDLLAVLPTLTESSADLLQPPETADKSSEVENKEEETSSESLAAATDAAVMAISNVAAAANKQILASSGKSIGKTAANGSLPATSSTQDTGNSKLKVKQEPSTSVDMQTDPSNMTLACTGSNIDESAFNRCGIPDDLDNHVDTMQTELDTLRDLLKGEGYSLDANTLLGVCAAIPAFEQDFIKLFSEDPLSDLPNAAFENLPDEQDKTNTTGNELATYSSNLLDMVDMFEGPGTGDWSAPGTPDSSIMDVSLSELNTPQMALMSPSFVSKKK